MLRDLAGVWIKAEDAIASGDNAITNALASYEDDTVYRDTIGFDSLLDSQVKGKGKKKELGMTSNGYLNPSAPVGLGDHFSPSQPDSPLPPLERPEWLPTIETESPTALTPGEVNWNVPDSDSKRPERPADEMQPDHGSHYIEERRETGGLGRMEPITVPEHLWPEDPDILSDPTRPALQDISDHVPIPGPNHCHYCAKRLQSPCWYCIDCPDTVLVCYTCDPLGGFDKGKHKRDHTLLKVTTLVEGEKTTGDSSEVIKSVNTLESKVEGRFKELGTSLRSLQSVLDNKMTPPNASLDQRLKDMEDRFSRLEGLLEKFLVKETGAEA